MMRITRVGFSLVAAMLVLAAGWTLMSQGATAGNGPAVAVDSVTIEVGETSSVDLSALDMPEPGLGAWSINVVYDPTVVEQQGCTPDNGSVCNPTFAADTVRISGATAAGMPGDTVLATIGFRCTEVGSSALTVTVDTLADGTPGDPQDIDAAIVDGTVTCLIPSTPTEPPPPPTPGNGTGGSGFPAAGGTYTGEVPGQGWVTIVIEPNGQGIEKIWVKDLVTVCGTVNQLLTFDPPLDIEEPGFSFALFAFSEGGALLSIEGFFAEDGTIPVNLIIDTSNEDFPGDASPCVSENQVIPLVLRRQTGSTVPPPPPGGSYVPPPSSGGGSYSSGGGSLPSAGGGPGLGIDAQNPVTWLIAAMIGAGLAWLSAGVAGAGLATVTSSTGGNASPKQPRSFMPSMRPVRQIARPVAAVRRSVNLPERDAPATVEFRANRSTPDLGGPIDAFQAPQRPDRP